MWALGRLAGARCVVGGWGGWLGRGGLLAARAGGGSWPPSRSPLSSQTRVPGCRQTLIFSNALFERAWIVSVSVVAVQVTEESTGAAGVWSDEDMKKACGEVLKVNAEAEVGLWRCVEGCGEGGGARDALF